MGWRWWEDGGVICTLTNRKPVYLHTRFQQGTSNHMCCFVLVALGNADGWSATPHKAYLFDSNYYTRGNCTLTIEHA